MKKNILIFFLFLCITDVYSQKLRIESFSVKDADLTARTHPRKDINGIECALIKVRFAQPKATFNGNIIGDVDYNSSEYRVYMPHGSKRLTITSEGYLPLEVSFPELGVKSLESKIVYELTIIGTHISDLFDKMTAQDIYDKILKMKKKNKDISEIIESCVITANEGDVRAQNLVGILYKKGIGVSQNYIEAVKWFRKAADQGNPNGQYNLGNMYDDGIGVSKDYNEAIKWFRKSAEQGHVNAQLVMGIKYYKGEGVRQDIPIAIEWLQKAAKQGNKDAKK